MPQYQQEREIARKLVEALQRDTQIDYSPQQFGSSSERVISLRRIRPRPTKELLFETYILAFIDRSGSMEGEVPAMLTALERVRQFLLTKVYGGDEAKTNQYFTVINLHDERWLAWSNTKIYFDSKTGIIYFRIGEVVIQKNIENSDPIRLNYIRFLSIFNILDLIETPEKAIILNYINESSPVYYGYSDISDVLPKDTYLKDYQDFIADYGKRSFFKGVVYSLSPSNIHTFFQQFQQHLQQAINGIGVYSYPLKLKDRGFEYRLSVPARRPAEDFLKDIQEILDEAKRS